MPKRVNEDGQVWAVPIGEAGFCPAVVARSADPKDAVGFSLVYLWPHVTAEMPAASELPLLEDWGQVWAGLVGRRPFSTGRWSLVGTVHGFEPADWPMPPFQETARPSDDESGWSVSTTGERPSLTVIANDAQPREIAERFPTWNIVTAPSALEKAIGKHLQSMSPNFHDMAFEPITVDRAAVRLWRDYGESVRNRGGVGEPEALPAGRKTDRSLAGGEWLAFPAQGGGFGVGLFLARPPKHYRAFSDGLVMVFARTWPRWPTLSEVRSLTIDDAVALGQTSMICVRDGRWRVLGRDTPFDAVRWPLPTPWTLDGGNRSVVILRTTGGEVQIPVDRAVVEADPDAGTMWSRSSSSYSIFEALAGRRGPAHSREAMSVTGDRVAVWRHVNERIEAELGVSILDVWFPEGDG